MSSVESIKCNVFFPVLKDFFGYYVIEYKFLVLTDIDGNLLASNPRYTDTFSAKYSDPPSEPEKEVLPNLTAEEVVSVKNQLLGGTPEEKVSEQKNQDGVVISVQWQSFSFALRGQKYLVKVGANVPAIEVLRQGLQKSGEGAGVGFWRLEKNARKVYWSPEVYEIHQVLAQEFNPTKENISGLLGEADWRELENSIHEAFGKGKPFVHAFSINGLGGGGKHIEIKGGPEIGVRGHVKAVSGTVREKTRETEMEVKYADAREKLSLVENYMKNLERTLDYHALVSITDTSGNIIFVNQKFCDTSGYSASELMGRNHRILKSGKHNPGFYGEIWKCISSGEVWQGEICNLNKTGRDYWVYSTIVPFLDENSATPTHYVSVRTDITEQKKCKQRQDELMRQALELSRVKNDFLANMSHELHTPLNAIIGYSEMIIEEYFGSLGHEKYMEYIQDIHSSGEKLLDLVNNVLEISQLETGKYEIAPAHVRLGRILQDKYDKFAPMAAARGIKLAVENPEQIDEVCIDEVAVRQILSNLLSNAIKFSLDGGYVSLLLTSDSSGCLVFNIRDKGIGMSREHVELALLPFGQVEPAQSRSHEGVGLGLPLCKHLVEMHGGILVVDSEIGKGTEVRIQVPYDDVSIAYTSADVNLS
ncbi:PAS domain-containing sensor histidine kinase [Emcibacter nanhaiensis]|uniref:histidine kinase n=1 Tax=Emcibacter nanhaiensis TaxID=1505037 RepID=A0A501PC42_9PROT|nr:PAS domain-containing sensor histidine kinase [Emcibacter nanhaiensis]TPD57940.1 PAS domain S-box protein [Emcibacter nanhaiensis]